MSIIRLLIYVAGLLGSVLAMAGYADFDMSTGQFALRPFNLYAFVAYAAGGVASAVAGVAWLAGWRGKK